MCIVIVAISIHNHFEVKPSCSVERIECAAPVSRVVSSTLNHIKSFYLSRDCNEGINEKHFHSYKLYSRTNKISCCTLESFYRVVK
jgi:hypothetical protein